MNAARLLSITLLVAALAAGCSASQPKLRYYTLVPPVAGDAGQPRLTPAIELLPVKVAAQADYPQLVLRQGAERFTLEENRLWVAPLPDEFRAALLARLAAVLPPQLAPVADPVRVEIEVGRLDSVLGRYALLEAGWRLKSGPRSLACASRSVQPVGKGFDALVAGHQRAVQALADDIAAGLTALGAAQPACPSLR